MMQRVVLVVIFRPIEAFERRHLGNDRLWEYLGGIQLSNVRVRDQLLFIVSLEDRGAIRRTDIRSLAVELRRVMRDRKEDPQQLSIGDF